MISGISFINPIFDTEGGKARPTQSYVLNVPLIGSDGIQYTNWWSNPSVGDMNNDGQLEIVVYRNGNAIGFGNTLLTENVGVQKDHDVQSKGSVVFEAGDVISVYLKAKGDAVWKDVITMVEITTTN